MKESTRVYLNQLKELTLSEWKMREQSSVSGFLWTLLNPALTFGVLYWIFTQWMSGVVPNYASKLLIGVVQYNFLNAGTTYGMTSLSRRRGIMMNFVLRRELLVVAAVLSMAISYVVEFLLMLFFATLLGARPTLAWGLLPVLFVASVAIVASVSLALSVLSLWFPDFERIWVILVTAGFFVTPVFYTLDTMSPQRQRWLRLNPATRLIEATRACVLGPRVPSARHWAVLFAACLALGFCCYALFKRHERKLGDYVLC